MSTRQFGSRCAWGAGGFLTLLGVIAVLLTVASRSSRAGWFDIWFGPPPCTTPGCSGCAGPGCVIEHQWVGPPGGTWYWLRSPEEERKVIMGLFNRYCIRCHGVDGRGVWDIPGVPDFSDPRFHACRSDGQLVRAILEGRGAVMPPFRGTLTLEEGWGMARYLRTLVPGAEKEKEKAAGKEKNTPDKLPPPATDNKSPMDVKGKP